MTKRTGLIATAWIASCGAAFYLGHSSSEPSEEDFAALESSKKSPRVSVRGDSNDSSLSERRRSPRTTSSSQKTSADFSQEVTDLAKLNDPIARAQGMLALVENLSPGEFEEVVATFRALGMTRERMSEYGILLTAWAKVDPIAALDYAKENTGTPFARQTILASWVQTQPDAAIAWAKGNFESDDEKRANPWLVGIIKGMASQNLSRASQLLEDLPFSEGRGDALGSILGELQQLGSAEAKNWISSLSDERLREGAAARLAVSLAEDDPKTALDWASSMSAESLKKASGEIVGDWASDDPEAAQAWVNQQTEDIQASAGRGLMNAMAKDDPEGASAWLSQHEGNPAFDGAVQSFVYNTIETEPEMGADWIMKMSDTSQSERMFHRVLGTWMRRDSEGAMSYIQNNKVPDSINQRAQRQLEEQNR
ncbi:MAG: hypothetical protein QNK83_10005 [Akkermansiaceae bacterium]